MYVLGPLENFVSRAHGLTGCGFHAIRAKGSGFAVSSDSRDKGHSLVDDLNIVSPWNRTEPQKPNRDEPNRANREPNRTNPSLQTEPNRDLDLYCCYYA